MISPRKITQKNSVFREKSHTVEKSKLASLTMIKEFSNDLISKADDKDLIMSSSLINKLESNKKLLHPDYNPSNNLNANICDDSYNKELK